MSMTKWNNDCKCNTVEVLDGGIGDVLAIDELEDAQVTEGAEVSQPLGIHGDEATEVDLLHRALEHPADGDDAEQDSSFRPREPTRGAEIRPRNSTDPPARGRGGPTGTGGAYSRNKGDRSRRAARSASASCAGRRSRERCCLRQTFKVVALRAAASMQRSSSLVSPPVATAAMNRSNDRRSDVNVIVTQT
jgi:hypothetical protein